MSSLSVRIAAAVADGRTRDEIIIELVQSQGISINRATREWAAYAKEAGLSVAVTSHKEEVLDWLADQGREWTVDAVRDAIVDIMDKWHVVESTARDYCKAYSEFLGVPHPTLDPREAIFTWFIETENPTKEDFIAFAVDGLKRSRCNANEYWKGYELHLALLAAKEARS